MRRWRPFVFGLLLCVGADVCPAASSPALPVAVFWVGEDGGASVVPSVDITVVENAFVSHGYRVLRADGASAPVFARVILADRSQHPESYAGQVVPLVVHGRGVVGGVGGEEDSLLGAPRPPAPQVRDQDLLAAFLVGIGADAKGEISVSACFSGRPCREVGLVGTPLAGRVTRFIVLADEAPLDDTPEGRRSRVLARLLEMVVDALPGGKPAEVSRRIDPPAEKRTVNGQATPKAAEALVDVRDRLLRRAAPAVDPVSSKLPPNFPY